MGLGEYRLRALTSEDVPQLKGFTCADAGHWAEDIQDVVRTMLPMAGIQSLSAWKGNDLAALITWEEKGDTWHSSILAVDRAHRRRGLGEGLKRELLLRARRAGVRIVASSIDVDNDPMIRLNEKLGARIEPVKGLFRIVRYKAVIVVNDK